MIFLWMKTRQKIEYGKTIIEQTFYKIIKSLLDNYLKKSNNLRLALGKVFKNRLRSVYRLKQGIEQNGSQI